MAHSKSPALFRHFFQHASRDGSYTLHDIPPGPRRVERARAVLQTLDGANLTVPFKQILLPELSAVSAEAVAVGAVNCVRRTSSGWEGTNTDVAGFSKELDEVSATADSVLILGAGGAARAVAMTWKLRGAQRFTIANRSRARAQELVRALSLPSATVRSYAAIQHLGEFDAVVNATSGGARDAVERLPAETLPSHAVWSDLNYWMPEPPHLARLHANGIRTTNGRSMLVHQAALAFEWFTGSEASLVNLQNPF